MSQPSPPKPAKLVIGFFLKERTLGTPIVENLVERFGDVDIVSDWMSFDQTAYYEPEMGAPLYRRMMTFETLIQQSALAQVKLFTNEVEKQYSDNGKRVVNIDPGYLLLERFVLATGKNFAHRIYIGKEIYADLTLIFRKGRFVTLPWSFPDYAGNRVQTFLMRAREKFAVDLKNRVQGVKGSRVRGETHRL